MLRASATKAKRTTAPKRKVSVPAKRSSLNTSTKLSQQSSGEKAKKFIAENIKKPKVFISLIVIIVLILLFLLRSVFVVALVNGQPISRANYEQQVQAQAGKQVMNSLVTEQLLEQEATRRHITVSQAELDAQLRTIQNQLATQGQTLDSALAAQGLSQASFMQQLKLQTLVEKMLADKIKVTDAEISDYVSKNQATLPTGESDTQIKSQVKQQLQQQKLSQQAQMLIQSLQSKAHIVYFLSI